MCHARRWKILDNKNATAAVLLCTMEYNLSELALLFFATTSWHISVWDYIPSQAIHILVLVVKNLLKTFKDYPNFQVLFFCVSKFSFTHCCTSKQSHSKTLTSLFSLIFLSKHITLNVIARLKLILDLTFKSTF